MAISNPVTPQGIVNRFEELVTDTVNNGIVWGINNKPFTEMPNGNYSLESTILGQQNLGAGGGSINVVVPAGANALHMQMPDLQILLVAVTDIIHMQVMVIQHQHPFQQQVHYLH